MAVVGRQSRKGRARSLSLLAQSDRGETFAEDAR
jgi:hypothetical protein